MLKILEITLKVILLYGNKETVWLCQEEKIKKQKEPKACCLERKNA